MTLGRFLHSFFFVVSIRIYLSSLSDCSASILRLSLFFLLLNASVLCFSVLPSASRWISFKLSSIDSGSIVTVDTCGVLGITPALCVVTSTVPLPQSELIGCRGRSSFSSTSMWGLENYTGIALTVCICMQCVLYLYQHHYNQLSCSCQLSVANRFFPVEPS